MATDKKEKSKGKSRTTRKVSKGVVKKSEKTRRDAVGKALDGKRTRKVVNTQAPPGPKPTRAKGKK